MITVTGTQLPVVVREKPLTMAHTSMPTRMVFVTHVLMLHVLMNTKQNGKATKHITGITLLADAM